MIKEEELVKQLKNKRTQEKAFLILMSEYKERLYWHIRKIVISHDDADDVLQNTFVKIFRNIANFKENSKLYSWMYRIATNESITFINKRAKQKVLDISEHQHHLAESLQDDVLYTGRTIRSGLDALLAFGRPEQVELLTLVDRRFRRDLPIQADYVGKTVDTLISERVSVEWKEIEGEDRVVLFTPDSNG